MLGALLENNTRSGTQAHSTISGCAVSHCSSTCSGGSSGERASAPASSSGAAPSAAAAAASRDRRPSASASAWRRSSARCSTSENLGHGAGSWVSAYNECYRDRHSPRALRQRDSGAPRRRCAQRALLAWVSSAPLVSGPEEQRMTPAKGGLHLSAQEASLVMFWPAMH